jgi:regulatory protein
MPVITALEPQKKNQQRINVFLDGAYGFAVSMDAAATLHQGQELGDPEIAALQAQDDRERAYQSALRYLGPRPRSQAEVERHLGNKGFAAPSVAAAIQRLTEQQYLNDEEFARYWLDNRTRFRPRSGAMVSYELRQRGVERETIAAALTELDEPAAAWAAVAPKLGRWQNLPQSDLELKIAAFLARRGFNFEVIRTISRRAWTQLQDEGDE